MSQPQTQDLDAQMQQAPATNPVADAWRNLADFVSAANPGALPSTSSRPTIPVGTPSEFAASIHRAYRRGGQAYHQQSNPDIEPEIPTVRNGSKGIPERYLEVTRDTL
jgi:hypothetical protein